MIRVRPDRPGATDRSATVWIGIASALTLAAPAAAGGPTARHLELEAAGPPAELARLTEQLRPVLAQMGCTLLVRDVAHIEPQETPAPPKDESKEARAWVDLGQAEAQVYFAGPGDPPVLLRTLPVVDDGDAVARAEIVEILVAALESRGLLPERERDRATGQVEDVPSIEATIVWGRAFGLEGAGEAWSADQRFVADIGLWSRVWATRPDGIWSVGVWTSLQYRPPFQTLAAPVGVQITGGELDVLGACARTIGRDVRLVLAAGVGGDARLVNPVAGRGATLSRSHQLRDVVLGARASLATELRLHRGWGVSAAVTIALWPGQNRFVVEEARGHFLDVYTPALVRPGLDFAVIWGDW
jgi:hypothetical protein